MNYSTSAFISFRCQSVSRDTPSENFNPLRDVHFPNDVPNTPITCTVVELEGPPFVLLFKLALVCKHSVLWNSRFSHSAMRCNPPSLSRGFLFYKSPEHQRGKKILPVRSLSQSFVSWLINWLTQRSLDLLMNWAVFKPSTLGIHWSLWIWMLLPFPTLQMSPFFNSSKPVAKAEIFYRRGGVHEGRNTTMYNIIKMCPS